MGKIFLHVDLDAFYASVEQLDNPELKGKPVIVGGSDRRSVVSTASYEARARGVHSAMPIFMAKRICLDGFYLPVRMKRYEEKSKEVMAIFGNYSPDVQQLSIDEAFIDLTGTERLFGDPKETARRLKKEVLEKTGLTVSIGLASTKYVAKIASGMKKPDGFFVVEEGKEEEFMLSLPLEKVWGIGEKTRLKLKSKGLRSVREIHALSLMNLKSIFGESGGEFLYNAVRGMEYGHFNREAKSHSISSETTFEFDLRMKKEIDKEMKEICRTVMLRARSESALSNTVCVKIRFGDFSTITARETFQSEIKSIEDLFEKSSALFWRKFIPQKGLRLLGVALQNVYDESERELSLFDTEERSAESRIEKTIGELERKFPNLRIGTAADIEASREKNSQYET
ncbi:MAG: DNA polymerase IV [Treponema sp.]|nr:DNA polymerase IV [Treponema sp.]